MHDIIGASSVCVADNIIPEPELGARSAAHAWLPWQHRKQTHVREIKV